MNPLDPITMAALGGTLLVLLSLLYLRARQRGAGRRPQRQEALDTVAAWPPEPARVMSVSERQAYDLIRRALPGFMVLAQVPLSRFLRVPTRHSYTDWLQRVGNLSADLLLCDSGSRVLAVIDIRSPQETERSRRRHERLGRVLRAANIQVLEWREGALPSAAEVRAVVGAALKPKPAQQPKPTASRPMPLIPVADIEEVLADGDMAAYDLSMEPVPSAFFEDMEPERTDSGRSRNQLSRA